MADACAVVTGVSKGLGEALAADLIERGFHVVGVGRSASKKLAGANFQLAEIDLADVATLAARMRSLFEALAARPLASIVVINNAAVAGPVGTVGQLDAAEVEASLRVNLAAPIVIADAFVRAFVGVDVPRRLINVSSGAAAGPIAGAGVYSIGKAGLEMLTRSVVADGSGIEAITIRPGIMDTPMQTFIRSQPKERLPSLPMFEGFRPQLVPPAITAAKIIDRLVVGPVDNGRVYSYAEL
ncbi:MAG TPA: SDR family NAD(P)-dependent oxidoreductase [Casimicrobiaceae bacterium]|nr:SDR family NAD(P)-dependent oxidoreductase [Casimicrobiaceae bacterium]